MHECNAGALKSACNSESSKQLYGHETERMVDDLMEMICPSNLRWGQPDCTQVDERLTSTDVPAEENMSILPLIINLMKRLAD